MKSLVFSFSVLFTCLPGTSLAESDGGGTPQVYLNENLGFNVEGYKYAQSEFPCDIDTALVEKIIQRASADDIQIEAVSTADTINNGQIPVLAIDIEGLVLGTEHSFGVKSASNLPSVRVTAALVNTDTAEGFTTARHSCAIATLNQLSPSSSVLDMGGVHTMCSAAHKCLDSLSKDIIQWVAPQIH